MVSDKELLLQSIEQYACRTAKKLFGISSLPAQSLIRYGIRNVTDKYGTLIDFLVDKEGHINTELLIEAVKSEINCRGGITVMGIKFDSSDLEEILGIYNKLSNNNG